MQENHMKISRITAVCVSLLLYVRKQFMEVPVSVSMGRIAKGCSTYCLLIKIKILILNKIFKIIFIKNC